MYVAALGTETVVARGNPRKSLWGNATAPGWHDNCQRARVRLTQVRLVIALVAMAGCTADILPGRGVPAADSAPEQIVPISVTLSAPRLRALSAAEYRRTVRDLLGLPVTTPLTHSDWTAGFDNGAGILVDDNLLAGLLDESEKLAAAYLATRAALDFPCVGAASLADACVKTLIAQLGRRAHRRPLEEAQRAALFGFFEAAAGDLGDRRAALEVVVARLITSVQFLYRPEVGRPTAPGSELYRLDDFEKAQLVSYTLTGSMPDEALLADAEAGRLDDAGLRRHVRRLWATGPARERVGDFFRQWLKVTRLDELAQRPADYPKLGAPALGASLKAEFDAFVAAVVFDGPGTLPALFSESFTFADANTAPLYGHPAPAAPTRLALDPAERRGVLTLASTMAALASADDPSQDRPVKRGLLVKEQLLCEEIGPPSGVNTLAAREAALAVPDFDQLTTREQYEAMMQQGAQCQSCHQQFMPLGFALGRYDALGRHRTEQRGRPVNAAVREVPFDGALRDFAGGPDLADAVAASATTARCFSQHFVGFTAGLPPDDHTETLSGALVQKLGDGPLRLAGFVEELLASPHLYLRRGPPRAPVDPAAGGGTSTPDAGAPLLPTTVLLAAGARLDPDGAAVSSDGLYRLLYQLDGNLVLYRQSGGALWASNTAGAAPGRAAMQGDGNLVVYDAPGAPRFHTGTDGHPGAELHIDGAGALFVIAPGGQRLWSSKGTP